MKRKARGNTAQHQRDTAVMKFFADHNMPYPRKGVWRPVNHAIGEINGLPNSRGIVTVTDGIMCYIVCADSSLYRGHYSWFIPDKVEKVLQGKALAMSFAQFVTE